MFKKLCLLGVSSCLLFGGSLFAEEEANNEVTAWKTKRQIENTDYNRPPESKNSYENGSCGESKCAPCKKCCTKANPCGKKKCCRKTTTCTRAKPCEKKKCCRTPQPCCNPPPKPCEPLCKDVTPSARGCHCRDGFIAFADFLWWTADEEQCLNIAFNNTNGILADHGDIINLDTGGDPGFRVGIGRNFCYDKWDLTGYWTYYHNSSSDSITAPTNTFQQGLIPTFLNSIPVNVQSITATWKLNFNAMNVDLGRSFYVSHGLSLKPYLSSETVWIRRWLAADALSQDPNIPIVNVSTPGKYRSRIHYWGTGPRVGMSTKWYLGCSNFNLMSNFSLSLLYGKGKTHAMTSEAVNGIPDQQGIEIRDACWTAVPHLQLMIGLGWESCFSCDRYFFNFTAGWEFNEFWHLRAFLFPAGFTSAIFAQGESIYMQGLTFRTQFEF